MSLYLVNRFAEQSKRSIIKRRLAFCRYNLSPFGLAMMRCSEDKSPPSSDSEPPYFNNHRAQTLNAANTCDNDTSVPALLLNQKLLERQHPRRTSVRIVVPKLVRQSDRKVEFVHSLVGKIYMIITSFPAKQLCSRFLYPSC
jgi:hypothetical protein